VSSKLNIAIYLHTFKYVWWSCSTCLL